MSDSHPKCQRCGRPEANVGPWDGSGPGGFTLLCGGCKCEVTLAIPGVRDRLARHCERIAEHLSANPSPDGTESVGQED